MHNASMLVPEMKFLHFLKDPQLPKTPALLLQEKSYCAPGVTQSCWHLDCHLQAHTRCGPMAAQNQGTTATLCGGSSGSLG